MSRTAPDRDRVPAFVTADRLAGYRKAGYRLARYRLAGFGVDAMAAPVTGRRSGTPGQGRADLERVASAVGALIRLAPGGQSIGSGGSTELQAARALSFALSRLSDGGGTGGRTAFSGRLARLILHADARAEAIRHTIAERRFRLAYQPVVSLADRELHHFEALLRPIQPPSGPVGTTLDFVTFSEAAGLSEELDLAVLERALAALGETPGICVAVNISGLSIQSRKFRDRMLALIGGPIDPGGVSPRLMIELTETAEIEDAATAAATLDGLRAVGVPVCLDDFGAGATAFRYLRDFRVDYVKIDGAYVRAAASGGRARGFVAAMRDLARSVGARVIAEMIETETEATLMAELGVQFGQGWLFGKPGALAGPGDAMAR